MFRFTFLSNGIEMTSHLAFAGGGGTGPLPILEESWQRKFGDRIKREHELLWKFISMAEADIVPCLTEPPSQTEEWHPMR